ncbi:MAG TPA: hypothetical protein VGM90_00100 [Kofleriaceae bacterium]|jgi:hypothetical protein
MFEPAKAKFVIGSIDNPSLEVQAQFNPKELQIDQPIKWSEHESFAAQNLTTKPVEFGGVGCETTKVELLFDDVEAKPARRGIKDAIEKLKRLARPQTSDELKGVWPLRPHYCVASWGDSQPRFDCVIESVSVKYTYFASEGQPLRAIVTLGLKSGRRPVGSEVAYSRGFQNKRMKDATSNEESIINTDRAKNDRVTLKYRPAK